MDLLEEVAQIAGFDYTLELVPDGRYGEKRDNKWNGMVGQIVNGVSSSKRIAW